MDHFLFHSPVKDLDDKTINPVLVPINEPLHNANECCEFSYDAIRMKDLPLIYTEECMAAGSPEGLL
ncbi:MAG TPA: hypothetical protein VF008_12680 [Niastella sp.]